jgi:hypothetical protein
MLHPGVLPLSWFFDFHTHGEVAVARDPDYAGIARSLAQAGVGEVIFHAKCHHGYSYYPTQVGVAHPRLHGDPLGEVFAACRREGLRVGAYISFGIDGEGVRRNPHWLQEYYSDRPARISPDHFNSVCPYSGYLEESVLPQSAEVLARYDVDVLWYDTMSALDRCYCPACRAAFRSATGSEQPAQPTDPGWPAYCRFRHDQAIALLTRIGSHIRQIKPGASVAFNQIGASGFPEPLPEGINRVSLDFATYREQSRQCSLCSAFASTLPYEADIMPTIFNGGWGDWSPAPASRQEQVVAALWARRTMAYMGDRLHPDFRLTPATLTVLSQIAEVRRRIEAHMPPPRATLAPDVLILHATSTQYGPDMSRFGSDKRAQQRRLDGAADLLIDAGRSYAIAPEHRLAATLTGATPPGLVLLPQLESIEPASHAALQAFLARGGQVLAVGTLPTVNGIPLPESGVEFGSEPWLDHVYVPDPPRQPVLVRGVCHKMHLRGAQAVLPAIAPIDMRWGIRMGWNYCPPGPVSDSVLLARASVGERGGALWTLAAPLCMDYETQGDWQQVGLMRTLVDRILPQARVTIAHEGGCVEPVVHVDDLHTWVYLVNHGGERFSSNRSWPTTWGPPPTYRPELTIRDPRGRRCRQVTANGIPLAPVDSEPGVVRVPLVLDTFWRIVQVTWDER